MRQYKNICTKENFEAEFLYLKLATLIYNKFLGWYDSYDQLCELLAEEGKYAIVGNTLTDAVVYEGTSSCWESTGVLFFQKFIDDFVSSEVTLTDELKRAICVLIGASYGSGEGSGSGSGSTIDIEKYLKEVGKYLKAGNHISITNNTISCLLEPGDGIAINNNKISCTDTKVFEIVDELPTSDIKDDKIYLLDEGNGKFSQYVYSGGGWNNITPKAEIVIPDGSGGDITKELILLLLGFDRNNTTQYLRKDGQWATPPDTNTTYNNATQSEAGLMSALDKKKLDALLNITADSLLNYGNDTTKYLRNDGTWSVPPDTKYNVATTSSNGLLSADDKRKLDSLSDLTKDKVLTLLGKGSDTTKYLRNDGLWAVPAKTTYNNATELDDGLMSAEDKRKLNKFDPDKPIIIGGNGNLYGVPSGSPLLTANPFTYVKVTLRGTEKYPLKHPSTSERCQLNPLVEISSYSGLALVENKDYYEELLPSKRMAFKNGEDVYTYESKNELYPPHITLGAKTDYSIFGTTGSSIKPYLYLTLVTTRNKVITRVSNNDIILLDNNPPVLIGNLNSIRYSDYLTNSQPSDNTTGEDKIIKIEHIKSASEHSNDTRIVALKVLDGKPHDVIYYSGAELVDSESNSYAYYGATPTTTYENRYYCEKAQEWGDGTTIREAFPIPSTDSTEGNNEFYTFYYILEHKTTFSNDNKPKQVLYKIAYPSLKREYYDGTGADVTGRIYGLGYEMGVSLHDGIHNYIVYDHHCQMAIVNLEMIVTTNYGTEHIPISEEYLGGTYGNHGQYYNAYIGGNKNTDEIEYLNFRIVYEIKLDRYWLPEQAYTNGGHAIVNSSFSTRDGVITPLKEPIRDEEE